MLALRGVPGIYFHSLFGSQNWGMGVQQTGRYRTINREKLKLEELERELEDPNSLRYQVFNGFTHMLKRRITNPAFHPFGGHNILIIDKAVFSLLRSSLDGNVHTLCITNVTDRIVELNVDLKSLSIAGTESLVDVLSDQKYPVTHTELKVIIAPYQVVWLKTQ